MDCLLLVDQSRGCFAQCWNSCSRGPAMWAQVLFHDLSQHRSHHSLILTQIFPFPDSGQFIGGDRPSLRYGSRACWWSIRSHYLRGRYPRQGGRQCRMSCTANTEQRAVEKKNVSSSTVPRTRPTAHCRAGRVDWSRTAQCSGELDELTRTAVVPK